MKKSHVNSNKFPRTMTNNSETSLPPAESTCIFGDFSVNPTFLDGTPVKADNGKQRNHFANISQTTY